MCEQGSTQPNPEQKEKELSTNIALNYLPILLLLKILATISMYAIFCAYKQINNFIEI